MERGRRESWAVLALTKGHVSTCCPVYWSHPLGALALGQLCLYLLMSRAAVALGAEVTLEVTCVLLPYMLLVGPFGEPLWVLWGLGALGCSLHCAEGCRGWAPLGLLPEPPLQPRPLV